DQPGFYSRNNMQWGLSSAGVTAGSDNVIEAFGEVEIPILAGMPFAEELTLNLSGRVFEYDSYGSDSVYKAGLNYQITPSVRVRGTYGTSYRTPALYEL
ncbi:TonB-dependent receptor, partial [Henriciella sp.]